MDATATVSTFGDSLIQPNPQRQHYAKVTHGPVTGMIHAEGWSAFTESGGIEHDDGHGSSADEALMLDLKWRMQAADRALQANRWAPTNEATP